MYIPNLRMCFFSRWVSTRMDHSASRVPVRVMAPVAGSSDLMLSASHLPEAICGQQNNQKKINIENMCPFFFFSFFSFFFFFFLLLLSLSPSSSSSSYSSYSSCAVVVDSTLFSTSSGGLSTFFSKKPSQAYVTWQVSGSKRSLPQVVGPVTIVTNGVTWGP